MMIVGELGIISVSQNDFFGNHIGMPSGSQSNWLQIIGSRKKRMIDPNLILRSVAHHARKLVIRDLENGGSGGTSPPKNFLKIIKCPLTFEIICEKSPDRFISEFGEWWCNLCE